MFFNFLINFLRLYDDPVASAYLGWYSGAGAIVGTVVPAVCSLVCVLLFYYLWSTIKATTTFHWLIMSLINMVLTYFVTVFIGRGSLASYINIQLGEEDLAYQILSWPFTPDLWILGLNAVIWAIVFYFVFSIIFKNWSRGYNIPFGKKTSKIQSKRK